MTTEDRLPLDHRGRLCGPAATTTCASHHDRSRGKETSGNAWCGVRFRLLVTLAVNNSERPFTEGNRVLPAPQISEVVLPITRNDIGTIAG
jgi:hypothetical protein